MTLYGIHCVTATISKLFDNYLLAVMQGLWVCFCNTPPFANELIARKCYSETRNWLLYQHIAYYSTNRSVHFYFANIFFAVRSEINFLVPPPSW